MFNLGRLRHLAGALGVEQEKLRLLLDDFDENPDSLVKELIVWPVDPSKKAREVICLRKSWRTIQERIYLKILLPRLVASRYSHGGVRGRNPASNARAHIGNRFAFATDITAFYPSIRCRRVNGVFTDHGCGYEVARFLTRLCTYDHHLALGLITSPILANEIFKTVDIHIARACRKIGLVYTRFVDDITISGNFDLETSGIASVVKNIVGRYGFALAPKKTHFGRLDRDICITGVRITGDHTNPSVAFMRELIRLIDDHASLAANGLFEGPLLVQSELFGKARYACYLNPGQRRSILAKLKKVNWEAVMNNALDRDLCRYTERITRRDEQRPSCELPLGLAASRKLGREIAEIGSIDHNVAPWEVVPR